MAPHNAVPQSTAWCIIYCYKDLFIVLFFGGGGWSGGREEEDPEGLNPLYMWLYSITLVGLLTVYASQTNVKCSGVPKNMDALTLLI